MKRLDKNKVVKTDNTKALALLNIVWLGLALYLLWKIVQTKKQVTEVKEKTVNLNQEIVKIPNDKVNFLFGDYMPSDFVGQDGDFYVNKSTTVLYKKVNGTWY